METQFSAEYSSSNNLRLGFEQKVKEVGQIITDDFHKPSPPPRRKKKDVDISFLHFSTQSVGFSHLPDPFHKLSIYALLWLTTHIDCVAFCCIILFCTDIHFVGIFSSNCTLFLTDPFRCDFKKL